MKTPSNVRSPVKDNNSPTELLYSPISLPESPAVASPQRNLTGLPRIARDIAADIYNSIQQWNSLHIKGASIISDLLSLKSNAVKQYPDGLEEISLELTEIINRLQIIVESLMTSVKQLISLAKLNKSPEPLFISWSVEKMVDAATIIFDAYEQEYKMKEYVGSNICHSKRWDKLVFFSACWAQQPYITEDLNINLESFLTETVLRLLNNKKSALDGGNAKDLRSPEFTLGQLEVEQ